MMQVDIITVPIPELVPAPLPLPAPPTFKKNVSWFAQENVGLISTPRKKTWSKTFEVGYGMCGNAKKEKVERDRSRQVESLLNYSSMTLES